MWSLGTIFPPPPHPLPPLPHFRSVAYSMTTTRPYHHPEWLSLWDLQLQVPRVTTDTSHPLASEASALGGYQALQSPFPCLLAPPSHTYPTNPTRLSPNSPVPWPLPPLQLYKTQLWVSSPLSLFGSLSTSGLRRRAKSLRAPTGIIRVGILALLHARCVSLIKLHKFLVCRLLICKREK